MLPYEIDLGESGGTCLTSPSMAPPLFPPLSQFSQFLFLGAYKHDAFYMIMAFKLLHLIEDDGKEIPITLRIYSLVAKTKLIIVKKSYMIADITKPNSSKVQDFISLQSISYSSTFFVFQN